MTEGITNPSEKYFKDGQWTYDGSVWRPQNQLLSYRDTVQYNADNADAPAGTVYCNFPAVPTGEVVVVTAVIGWDDTNACTFSRIVVIGHTASVYIDSLNAPARYAALKFSGHIVLKATEYMGVWFYGVTLHDVLVADAVGYSFKIAE